MEASLAAVDAGDEGSATELDIAGLTVDSGDGAGTEGQTDGAAAVAVARRSEPGREVAVPLSSSASEAPEAADAGRADSAATTASGSVGGGGTTAAARMIGGPRGGRRAAGGLRSRTPRRARSRGARSMSSTGVDKSRSCMRAVVSDRLKQSEAERSNGPSWEWIWASTRSRRARGDHGGQPREGACGQRPPGEARVGAR